MDKKDKVWISAGLGPLLVLAGLTLAGYLLHQWYPRFHLPGHSYLVTYAIALGVGVASIDTLDIARYQKAFVLVLYIPFMILTVLVIDVTFGCLAFGHCL